MLCAERLPGHCHRALIADYLTLQGVEVVHLIDVGYAQHHRLNPKLRRESTRLVYDCDAQGAVHTDRPCSNQ